MHRNNRTFALALIIFASAAVFVGLSAFHAQAAPSISHVSAATNEPTPSAAGQSTSSTAHPSLVGGLCHRCAVAHPYEAKLVGA